MKILLAEDSVVNQRVALAQLNFLGYEADVAANGQEVLELIQHIHYDLILMDCQMPILNGYETTRMIRLLETADRHITIIAMTASAVKAVQLDCLAVGMDDYLRKPVAKEDLEKKLTHWAGILLQQSIQSDQPPSQLDALEGNQPQPQREDELIDWEYLHQLSNYNTEFEFEVLQTLVTTLPAKLEQLQQCIVTSDCLGVGKVAHYIRGTSSSSGAISLQTYATHLEEQAIQGDLTGSEASLEKMRNALNQITCLLENNPSQ